MDAHAAVNFTLRGELNGIPSKGGNWTLSALSSQLPDDFGTSWGTGDEMSSLNSSYNNFLNLSGAASNVSGNSTFNSSDISEPETSDHFSDVIPAVIVTIVSCISIATVFGNIAIIVCIARNRSMFTVYNIYAASLAFADLLVGVVVMTSMSVYSYYNLWPLGSHFCTVWILFDFTCCTISMLHLDAIAFDRYKSVTSPLVYRTTFTKRRAVKISLFMWVLGGLLWLPPILYFRVTEQQMGLAVEDDCYFIPDKYFIAGQVTAAYYIPMVFMVALYVLLFYTLNKRLQETQKAMQTTSVATIEGLGSNGNTSATQSCPARVHKTSILKSARSLESAKISAQNRRCIRTLGAIIAVFLLCWLPFVIFWPLAAFCETCVPAELYAASYWLAYANSFVNPYIYFLLNSDFRVAFRKTFLGRHRKGSSYRYSTGSELSSFDDAPVVVQ